MSPNDGVSALDRLLARVRPLQPMAWTAELATEACAAFAPVLSSGAGEKENSANRCSDRDRLLGAAAASVVRAALSALDGSEEDLQAGSPHSSWPHLSHAAASACDALAVLGPSAFGPKARPREVVLQRYALARKLVAKGCHAGAASHAAAVLRALSTPLASPGATHGLPPPLPPPPEQLRDEELVTLSVGAALCYAGASAEGRSTDELLAAVAVAQSLPAWLRCVTQGPFCATV